MMKLLNSKIFFFFVLKKSNFTLNDSQNAKQLWLQREKIFQKEIERKKFLHEKREKVTYLTVKRILHWD